MRVEALAALDGVEMILHAGDVGSLSVLRELEGIAPVHAVYGNCDDPALGLRQSVDLTLEGVKVHVSHGHEVGSPTPERLTARYTADVIVFGHTHKPLIEHRRRSLVINPGAAGPRRFNLSPSVAILHIEDGAPRAEIIPLNV